MVGTAERSPGLGQDLSFTSIKSKENCEEISEACFYQGSLHSFVEVFNWNVYGARNTITNSDKANVQVCYYTEKFALGLQR